MRTTLTIDDDLLRRLKDVAHRTGRPFKDVVNEHLRLGLDRDATTTARPFTVVTRPMGLRPGISLDSASALLESLDGPAAR